DTCSVSTDAPGGSAYFDRSSAGAPFPNIPVIPLLVLFRTFQVQSAKKLAPTANASAAAPATAINTTPIRFIMTIDSISCHQRLAAASLISRIIGISSAFAWQPCRRERHAIHCLRHVVAYL